MLTENQFLEIVRKYDLQEMPATVQFVEPVFSPETSMMTMGHYDFVEIDKMFTFLEEKGVPTLLACDFLSTLFEDFYKHQDEVHKMVWEGLQEVLTK